MNPPKQYSSLYQRLVHVPILSIAPTCHSQEVHKRRTYEKSAIFTHFPAQCAVDISDRAKIFT